MVFAPFSSLNANEPESSGLEFSGTNERTMFEPHGTKMVVVLFFSKKLSFENKVVASGLYYVLLLHCSERLLKDIVILRGFAK